MNLCRMSKGVVFEADLYTLQGRLEKKEDNGWESSRLALNWPRTEVPSTWVED